MLANQRDELVGRDQKCDCIDKPKQSQNDESRQPIGISECEKPLENPSPFIRSTANAAYQHPTRRRFNAQAATREIRIPTQAMSPLRTVEHPGECDETEHFLPLRARVAQCGRAGDS